MPTSSGEWSSPFEGAPPASVAAIVAEVVSRVAAIPASAEATSAFYVPDRARIVSVVGGRGTGKSTVLAFAANQLGTEGQNLVLPTIDPESFAPGDSLLGWALAHLERELSESDRAFSIQGDETLGGLFEQVRRNAAARGSSYLHGLEQSGLSLDDFSRDAVKMPAHGAKSGPQIVRLFEALARSRDLTELRVIVPIDDADLFPELLPSIVRDAQQLSSSPRIVLLFAADERSLTHALQVSYLRALGNQSELATRLDLIDAHDVRLTASKRLVKHFPRSLRVQLPNLNPENRVGFVPIVGGTDSLRKLLSQFRIPGSDFTVEDLFSIRDSDGNELSVSPYANVLSDNPRDLRQLYEALSVIDPDDPHAARTAVWAILSHGLDALKTELSDRVLRTVELSGSATNPSMVFDFSAITHGKTVRGSAQIFRRETAAELQAESRRSELGEAAESADRNDSLESAEPDLQRSPMLSYIRLRVVSDHYSVDMPPGDGLRELQTSGQETHKEHNEVELPTQFTYLTWFAWEAIQSSDDGREMFDNVGIHSRPIFPGGRNWSNTIGSGRRSEDWNYWTIPEWEAVSDVFTFQEGWRRFVQSVPSNHELPEGAQWLELALIVHLTLVLAIQRDRKVPTWIAEMDPSELLRFRDDVVWDSQLKAFQSTIETDFAAAYQLAKEGRHQRDQDFESWVVTLFVLTASELLTTTRMSDWLLSLWRSNVDPRYFEDAARVVASQARSHIGTPHALGDIELLERLVPNDTPNMERARSLREVESSFARRDARQKAEIIAKLNEAGVETTLTDALQRDGATQDVLGALVLQGVRAEALAAIAETFPSTVPAVEEKVAGVPPDRLS